MSEKTPVENANRNLVWIDCEMTGLDPDVDTLVEVAVLVTDSELNILGDGVDVVIKPSDAAVTQMNDFVTQMHTSTGLINEWEQGMNLQDASAVVMDYITTHCPTPRTALLAGNTVGQDKLFLTKEMPAVTDHLHYRIVDVSSIKELAKRWFVDAYENAPEKSGNHRALGDIVDSINELRYYRDTIMVPSPGPTAAQAQKIAGELELYQTADYAR
ncbi:MULTISPECIES: oligoribonuclease [Auritidibacter]|uniref:oligoribonuclease n=1 Tax=Auritidibacter TaxID=1160973 RepID=UPI000D737FD6|nr:MULTISPECIES: oligoribonuclease [Auritidibacter]AXR73344.1 oligoribonuclease [Auritidibacter sp. NML130574]NIH70878.1 oligoribonuclease [Auritidibacter ignavus]PXA76189.1 oligoribonuclease [Auritidibacter sp. NML100628]PXA82099.1 oligoribonuclease [Auritidibacter sp. NML120636]RMX24052.1 oligoribonuclease [Auritidibacter ignavus]